MVRGKTSGGVQAEVEARNNKFGSGTGNRTRVFRLRT